MSNNFKINKLSEEEIKMLQNNGPGVLSSRELLQAHCLHRNFDNRSDSLMYDSKTGIAKCEICGSEFKPIDLDVEDLESQDLNDVYNTIKVVGYDILPHEEARGGLYHLYAECRDGLKDKRELCDLYRRVRTEFLNTYKHCV